MLLCVTPAHDIHVHEVGTPKLISIESKFFAAVVYMSFFPSERKAPLLRIVAGKQARESYLQQISFK